MKKIKYILCLSLVCCFCAFCFVGCGNNKDEKASMRTLSLSVNPAVTFIIDEDNEVVSLSYDNEDAGRIFVNTDFTGKSVDSAVQIFIEKSAISGHINLSETNAFKIKVNGQIDADIEMLEKEVKEKAENVFQELGVNAQINISKVAKNLRKNTLVTSAKIYAPEKSDDELNKMTESELIKLIGERQKQLEQLAYSQINDYIENFSAENLFIKLVEQTRSIFETAKKALENVPEGSQKEIAKQSLKDAEEAFEHALETLEENREEYIENAKALVEQTKDLLEEEFKQEVISAKNNFISHINNLKTENKLTQKQYDYWRQLIEQNS